MYNIIKNIQNIQNVQRFSNNVVIVNPKLLILTSNNTLEIERREKNTYYNKIIGV
jgi:hypothetical protein